MAMAMVSMLVSLPTLTPSNSRRVNRFWQTTPKTSSSVMAVVSGAGSKVSATAGVKFAEGEEKLPKVVLTSAGGSEADVYLYGGVITSWKVPNGRDLLFVRPDAVFNKKKPISGGVPHCFPQFGPGPMQQHGFARNLDWSVIDSENVQGDPTITLELKDGEYSRSMWDFSFQALYKVTLQPKGLSTELVIKNTDSKPFSFSTALHTYFRAAVQGASVKGLKGCKTLNKDPDPKNPLEGKEERDGITFPGFVDCVYLDAPDELHLDNGLGDVISIKNTNWTDAVLWNPYLTMEACYKDFVCVENAKIGNVQLEPGNTWIATQHLSIN
ncbi:putative glucose-6-phosphate 1-epimerase [Pyrus communis]|uniref:putative glucose-6-phosphate 1-epimerase n=1 Tax=Pyrus communis TaxID=23211 RepID=UPI0035BFFA17